ncbi:amidohydrolase family protein [Actinomycetota bacterium]
MVKINIGEEIKKFKIIDSHMHLGIGFRVLYYNYSDDRVIELEKRFNVKKAICSHLLGIFGDLDAQLEEILKVQKKFGDFICWQLIYDGRQTERSLDIIEKYKQKINFIGVKIWSVGSELYLDDRKYYPLWEYAVSNDFAVSAHTWSPYTDNPKQIYGNPLLLKNVLKDFPQLKVILVHSGGKVDFYDEVIELLKEHKTLYMDFSGDCFYPLVFKKVLNRIGKGRALFGTDMPMMDIRYHISNVIAADISDSDKEDIFYNNAARLFNI